MAHVSRFRWRRLEHLRNLTAYWSAVGDGLGNSFSVETVPSSGNNASENVRVEEKPILASMKPLDVSMEKSRKAKRLNVASTSTSVTKGSMQIGGTRIDMDPVEEDMGQLSKLIEDFRNVVATKSSSGESKEAVAQKGIELAHRLHGKEIANIFNCCKRGGFVHKELFKVLGSRIAQKSRDILLFLTPIEMSMLIQSLGMLHKMNGTSHSLFDGFDATMSLLVSECLRREQSVISYRLFNEQSIANVVHGLGWIYKREKGGALPDNVKQLVDVMLRKLKADKRIRKCKPQELSNILHGCANMGFQKEGMYELFCAEIKERVMKKSWGKHADKIDTEFECQHISNIVWAFAKLDFLDQGVLGALAVGIKRKGKNFKEQELANIVYGFGQLGYKNDECFQALKNEIVRGKRLEAFSEQELSNVVYAFGRLGYRTVTLLHALSAQIIKPSRLEKFKEQELANIIYGFGQITYRNDHVLDALKQQICDPERARKFKVQELSNIVYGLGRLVFTDDEILNVLAGEIGDSTRMGNFSEQHLANIVHGFSLVGYVNEGLFSALCDEMCSPRRLEKFNEQEISNIIHGFGRLRYKNDALLDALNNQILNPTKLEQFTHQALANVVDGMAKMGYKNEGGLHVLCLEMAKPMRLKGFKVSELGDIVYGLVKLDYKRSELLSVLGPHVLRRASSIPTKAKEFANILRGLKKLGFEYESDTTSV